MAVNSYIIGVDEAGRGPLAGPVTAAAVLLPRRFKLKNKNPGTGIRDSKKYSERQREDWFSYIENDSNLVYEHSSVWQMRIDRMNISKATNLAATRAVERLIERNNVNLEKTDILLDGALKLNSNNLDYKVIIKGDEKEDSIKLASIVAKVKRDSSMRRIHRKHSMYSFISNKGYGTREHRNLIREHGPCRYHRKTFLGSFKN